MKPKLEKMIDDLLQNSDYKNEPAIDFYNQHSFYDVELFELSKEELIRLLGKTFFAVEVMFQNNGKLIKLIPELLEHAENSQSVKTKILEDAKLREMYIRESVLSSNASSAGKARLKTNKKIQRMNEIVEDYRKEVDKGYNFEIAGRLTEFYEKMYKQQNQADQDSLVKQESIKKRIERERKKSLTK